MLLEAPVITEAGASPQTRAMVREANANTWFVVERLGEVRAPGRGSRPGDPFGNVIFTFRFGKVLDRIDAAIKQDVPVADIEWDGNRSLDCSQGSRTRTPVGDTSLADDLALVTVG